MSEAVYTDRNLTFTCSPPLLPRDGSAKANSFPLFLTFARNLGRPFALLRLFLLTNAPSHLPFKHCHGQSRCNFPSCVYASVRACLYNPLPLASPVSLPSHLPRS